MEFRHFIPIFLIIALLAGILLVAFGYSVGYKYAGFIWSSDNSGTSIRPLMLKQNVTCPEGLLTVYATSVGDEIANVNISVVLVSPFVGEVSSQLSNYTGGIQVNLTRSGNYEVDGSLQSYQRPDTQKFYFDYAACKQVAGTKSAVSIPNNVSNASTTVSNASATSSNVSITNTISNPLQNQSVNNSNSSDTYVPGVVLSDQQLALEAQNAINDAQTAINNAQKNGADVTQANQKLSLSKIALASKYYAKSVTLANDASALAKDAKAVSQPKVQEKEQTSNEVTQTDFTGAIIFSAVFVFIAIVFVSYYLIKNNNYFFPQVSSNKSSEKGGTFSNQIKKETLGQTEQIKKPKKKKPPKS